MDEDISRKAVLVLVLLSVVISIISTTLVMNTVYHVNISPTPAASEQKTESRAPTGVVTLNVPAPSVAASTTGKVVFEVK